MSLLSVKNLTLKYKTRTLLKDVSFEVERGEIIALTGRNGLGKSTLFRRIGALENYDLESQGDVFIDGVETLEMSIADRCEALSIVFQNPDTQSFCTTVLDELAFSLENLMVKRENMIKRINAVVTRLKLEHLINRKISSLSGGERQLVLIASCLVMDAKLLLADELTARIDRQKRPLIHQILKEEASKGKAVLMISHSEDDQQIANRIVNLERFSQL